MPDGGLNGTSAFDHGFQAAGDAAALSGSQYLNALDRDTLIAAIDDDGFRCSVHEDAGLLNSFLNVFGIKGAKWLTDPKIAFWSVMGVDIWKGMGYIMTIFIAGIMSISPTSSSSS